MSRTIIVCIALLSFLASAQDILTSSYSNADIARLKPYTHYASTAYCEPDKTLTWTCGDNCNANPSFKPIASGGDGQATQYWYVGYDMDLDSIIVAHQGLNMSNEEAVLTVLDFALQELPTDLFPGLDKAGIVVHRGFAMAHVRAAEAVLDAVQKGIKDHSTKKIVAVGHSLGAALSLFDAIHFKLKIPDVEVEVIAYGMPRVGNTAFADYVDDHIKITRINNGADPVPIIPDRETGFYHPSGEIRIHEGEWIVCPGQENDSPLCSAGAVIDLFAGNLQDHAGPYDGVLLGCKPPAIVKPVVVVAEDDQVVDSIKDTPVVEIPVGDKPVVVVAPKDEL